MKAMIIVVYITFSKYEYFWDAYLVCDKKASLLKADRIHKKYQIPLELNNDSPL